MSTEASVSYAALILADAEQEITSEKLLAITKAAGANVDQVWADVFAKAVEGKNLKELLFSLLLLLQLPVLLLVLLLVLLPVVKLLLKKPLKKKLLKNLMTTWVSVYSIKEFSQTNK